MIKPRRELFFSEHLPACGRWAWPVALAMLVGLGLGACTEQESSQEAHERELAIAQKLKSLPYVATPRVSEENRGLRGVVAHDPERAYPGLNLYGSLTSLRAHLRSMSGEIVHSWDAEGVFTNRRDFPLGPGVLEALPDIPPGLLVAELYDRHLLTIETFSGLIKLDWDSKVVFARPNHAHHDVEVGPDGSLWVLTAAQRQVETGTEPITIIDDVIEHLAPDGALLQSYSIFEILAEDPGLRPLLAENIREARYWFQNLEQWEEARIGLHPSARSSFEGMFRLYDEAFVQKTRALEPSHALYVLRLTPADMLHSNSIEVLPAREDGLWESGNVLVSVRNLDLIAVVDLDARRVVWSWGPGEVSRQHQPSLLANGNLLIFDNGVAGGRSRVIELDPSRREIVWTYGDQEKDRFFCSAMGGVQGLPNGNVLITYSSAGRVFEVDRDGQVVWDFFNPNQGFNPFDQNSGVEVIESIYRLERVEP